MATDRVESSILRPLVQSGKLPSENYLPALEAFRDANWWDNWALRALFALAVGHILAGVIFFFAHNWFGLADSLKFGLVGGGIGISVLLWIGLGLDSLAGKSFGIAATVLVGVMFAVFGQVYQTPSLLHTPFVLWAFMTLPFAAVSRNLAHWAVWLIIALVAMFAYAETGFYIAGHPLAADMLIGISALLAVTGIVVSDRFIRPQYSWARASWFRLFLIAVGGGLLVTVFTSTFWPWRHTDLASLSYVLSVVAFLLSLGLIFYLYKFKPTLAGLTIATFASTAMVVQMVVKLFEDFHWDIGIFFAIFVIFTGITVGLGGLFKHFAHITRHTAETSEEEADHPPGLSLQQASVALSVSEDELSSFQDDIEARENPWYIETFLAFAGMVTAGFGIAFFGLLLTTLFKDDNFGVALLGVGVPLYAGAILTRKKLEKGYLRHLFNTLLMVGAAMIVGGLTIAMEVDTTSTLEIPLVCILILAALNITFIKDPIIEFLSAIIAMGALYFYLGEDLNLAYYDILLVGLATGLAMFFLTRILNKRLLTAAASALLIYSVLASLSFGFGSVFGLGVSTESLEWTRYVYSFAGVLIAGAAIAYLNVINPVFKKWRPPFFVLIPILVVMVLFPFGGASAMLLILTGYILGHRTFAILGVLLEIYYLYMFYYELSISLGTKSYILMAVGVVFLGVWYFSNRHQTQEALT